MSKTLTDEQSEVLEKAALLVINARREARAMLANSRVPPDDPWGFGNKCKICGCTDYTGDGPRCETRVTSPGSSITRPCGHKPSQHLMT